MSACSHGLTAEVHRLLLEARTANVDVHNGNTLLQTAAIHGYLDVLVVLLEMRTDPNGADDSGVTALHWACYSGNLEMAEKLIAWGADVNARDVNKCSPLFLAAQHGHLRLTRVLLHARASVHSVNNQGRTALMLASSRGHADIVRLLLVYGCEPLVQDVNGLSSLDHARTRRHTAVFQLLLDSCMNRMNSHEQGSQGRPARRSFAETVNEVELESSDSWEGHLSELYCRMNKEIVGDLYARLIDFKQQNLAPDQAAAQEQATPAADRTAVDAVKKLKQADRCKMSSTV